jgi:hypothetical protein
MGLFALALSVYGVEYTYLRDDFDEMELVRPVSAEESVNSFRKKLDDFKDRLGGMKEADIEKLFERIESIPRKTYALPVAERRVLAIPGFRRSDSKRHCELYAAKDLGIIIIFYGNDGESPWKTVVYFKVDKDFPTLTATNLEQRLAWDRQRLDKLAKYVEEREKEVKKEKKR